MRLIDADALESKKKTIYMEHEGVVIPTRVISIADLHLAPTVDAVEVVRCKECKKAGNKCYGYVFCDAIRAVMPENGFCYAGAKMDAEVEG